MKGYEEMSVEPLPRPSWRESMVLAADLALLGIVVVLACVPVVSAGAALTTASVAVNQVCDHRSFPALPELFAVFRRTLLRGLVAVLAVLVVTALLLIDVATLRSGAVPGGPALLVVTALLGAAGLALVLTALVRLGQTGGHGYRAALRWAGRLLTDRPWAVLAIAATVAVPTLLAGVAPVITLFLPGFVLFGLHAVVRRISR